MAKSERLRLEDVRGILGLVGECREQGDDGLAWRRHLIEGLAGLVDADLGSAGEMQGCRELTIRDLGVTHWAGPGIEDLHVVEAVMEDFRRDPACAPTILAYLDRANRCDGVCLTR